MAYGARAAHGRVQSATRRLLRLGAHRSGRTGELYRPLRASGVGDLRPQWRSGEPGCREPVVRPATSGAVSSRHHRIALCGAGASSADLCHGLCVIASRHQLALSGYSHRSSGIRTQRACAGRGAAAISLRRCAHGRPRQDRRHMGDRATWRQRRGSDNHHGSSARRPLCAARIEVVYQQRQQRSCIGDGAAPGGPQAGRPGLVSTSCPVIWKMVGPITIASVA